MAVALCYDRTYPNRNNNRMRSFLIILLLVSSIAWGQDAPQKPVEASQPTQATKAPRHDDDTEPPPASAAKVAPDAPVITIGGLCAKKEKSAEPSKEAKPEPTSECKTVVTREQFEKLVEALNPQMSGPVRKQLAEAYPRLLVFADKARELGIDQEPGFHEMMRFATLQLLTQRLTRHLQENAGNITDADAEKYYKENNSRFERAELLRVFIPKQKQLGAGGGSVADNKAADEAAMKAVAEKIHTNAVGGKDFQQLQKEAFEAAGIASSTPKVDMGKLSPGNLPVDHKKVFDLEVGQVSELISDGGGYYIYKVISKEAVPLDQARPEINKTIQSQRMQESTEALTKSIKSELNQEYFVGGTRKTPKPATTQNGPAEK